MGDPENLLPWKEQKRDTGVRDLRGQTCKGSQENKPEKRD